jgi:HEAT repeat protein
MDFFLDRIADPSREVRVSAHSGVYALLQSGKWEYRREEAIALFLSDLDDEDPTVRRSAIGTASNARILEALPLLKRMVLYDGDAQIRRSAQQAIDVLEGRNPCTNRPVPLP